MPRIERNNKKGKLLQSHGQYFLAFSHRLVLSPSMFLHSSLFTQNGIFTCTDGFFFTLLQSSSQIPISKDCIMVKLLMSLSLSVSKSLIMGTV